MWEVIKHIVESKILLISQVCHRKKVDLVLTSLSIIVKIIDIPSDFEKEC